MLIVQHGQPRRADQRRRERAPTRDSFRSPAATWTATSDPRSRYYTKANKNNDYLRDFELEKTTQFCGILFAGNLQDRAMTELMCNEDGIEPIYDRSQGAPGHDGRAW